MTRRPSWHLLVLAAVAGRLGAGELDSLYGLAGPEALVETARLELEFDVHRPRGLEKVGSRFFLATAEVREDPVRRPDGTWSTGAGRGHLLVLNTRGEQLEDLDLGQGDRWLPGGMASDGVRLWIPVAEARPDSHTLVYTVTLDGLRRRRAFDFPDHLALLAADPARRVLHAWSWDGRRRYVLSFSGRKLEEAPEGNGFVAYRSARVLPDGNLLATGALSEALAARFPAGPDTAPLGALALLTARGQVTSLLPLLPTSPQGRCLASGPMALEWTEGGPRLHFAPDHARTPIVTLAPRSEQVDIGLRVPEPAR